MWRGYKNEYTAQLDFCQEKMVLLGLALLLIYAILLPVIPINIP